MFPAESPTDASSLLDAMLATLLGLEPLTSRQLQDVVAEVGGIPFPSEVPVEFLTRDGLRAYLEEAVASEYPPAEAEADARVLTAFGLLEPGTDLAEARRRLLERSIAGFYDDRPDRRRLYVVSEDRSLTPMNQLILAHELRHALQDQHVNVHDRLPSTIGDFDDRRLAFLAVLEGDATLVMDRFLRERIERAGRTPAEGADFMLPMDRMPGIPPILRDQMVLPYLIGTPFTRELWRRGGWPAVQKAWSEPPESSEQVLHPEKYWADEPPAAVTVDGVPEAGALVQEGVLGEAYLRTLLGDGSETAAAGWGGDRYRLWRFSGRKTLLVWRAVWETAADAEEFEAAVAGRYARTHRRERAQREWSVFAKGEWRVATARHALDTWLVSSDHPPTLRKTLKKLTPRKGDQ